MLGGNLTVEICDDIVEEPCSVLRGSGKGSRIGALRLHDIVVNISVAEMAEGDRPGSRVASFKGRLGSGEKCRDP